MYFCAPSDHSINRRAYGFGGGAVRAGSLSPGNAEQAAMLLGVSLRRPPAESHGPRHDLAKLFSPHTLYLALFHDLPQPKFVAEDVLSGSASASIRLADTITGHKNPRYPPLIGRNVAR